MMQPDGIQVGWVDLSTGERHLVADALRQEFEAALTAYGDVPGQLAPACTAELDAVPSVPCGEQEWTDLAANRPGAGARARARRGADDAQRSRMGGWVARALDLRVDEREWRAGAIGDDSLGARLDRLSRHGWHVLHGVPLGSRGSTLEHVLVGPGGVLTVATRRHPGRRIRVEGDTVTVAGQRVPYVGAARHDAARASALLATALERPVPVTPVLVLLTGTFEPDVEIVRAPEDVVVVDRTEVPSAFRRLDERLSPAEVDEVFEVARRSTTWTSG